MSVRKKSFEGEFTDTTGRDGASECVTATVGRGDLHSNVVLVDERDVIRHRTRDSVLHEEGRWLMVKIGHSVNCKLTKLNSEPVVQEPEPSHSVPAVMNRDLGIGERDRRFTGIDAAVPMGTDAAHVGTGSHPAATVTSFTILPKLDWI